MSHSGLDIEPNGLITNHMDMAWHRRFSGALEMPGIYKDDGAVRLKEVSPPH